MRAEFFAELVESALKAALAPVAKRFEAAEAEALDLETHLAARLEALEGVFASGHYLARLEALEARAPLAGPPGPPGADGIAGKDGAPGLRYAGVFVSGKRYELGEIVTWGGSAFHCQRETEATPGEGSADWQLMVKHGRDLREPRRP